MAGAASVVGDVGKPVHDVLHEGFTSFRRRRLQLSCGEERNGESEEAKNAFHRVGIVGCLMA